MQKYYKLLDTNTKRYAGKKLLSFSRLIKEFPGSEGHPLYFIVEIYQKIEKGIPADKIQQNKRIKRKILEWYEQYLKALGLEVNDDNKENNLSTLKILIYMHLNKYCSCFIKENIFCEEKKKEYLKKNKKSIVISDKTAVARINFKYDIKNDNKIYGYKINGDYIFSDSKKGSSYVEGHLRFYDVEYLKKPYANKIINIFANDGSLSNFYKYQPIEFCEQKEKRAAIILCGLEPHTRTIALNSTPSSDPNESIDDRIVRNAVEAVSYLISDKYPDYIYLLVDDIKIKSK